MMVSEKVTERIRRFVCDQLRNQPDLSTLTLGILKKRYLVLVGLESLSPEDRNYMKQVVEEELSKMQEIDENGVEPETEKPHNKRKREKENDDDEEESGIEDEDESTAKKSRRQINSESEDNEGHKTGSEGSAEEENKKSGSEDAEQEVEKSQLKKSGNLKRKREGEDSPVEDVSESGGSDSEGPKDIGIKKENSTKNTQGSSSTSPGKKTPQSDEENETDTERKSERSDQINESSDDSEKKEKVPVKKENNQDSDSSALTSLDDDQETGRKKNDDDKKTVKKDEKTSGEKDEHKQVVRLKRYISLCGVKRNYKKLLDDCHSVPSMVAVLKKELDDLGVQGQPSIKKCKSVKRKREEAQEIADLDVSNIISTSGRPKRRGASVRWEGHDSPSSTYKRTLNSASDSDEENRTHKVHRRATDWTNLQGIVSDDADSD
ncbi:HIRA-interacting protein 3 isoform X1 [Hippoglossus hippoglossus]|uniref:HIRA-interacting protein 3 isoform X1 n=1 Tax=Hippoglossus hippoglossus TaxID=8267 RepID=UPI00148D781E|nr:HIRA-interacting protein 3 isoform X1 [Hippoglossus hippoglossus]